MVSAEHLLGVESATIATPVCVSSSECVLSGVHFSADHTQLQSR